MYIYATLILPLQSRRAKNLRDDRMGDPVLAPALRHVERNVVASPVALSKRIQIKQ